MPPSDVTIRLPAREVSRGTTRANVPGFDLDRDDSGQPRVYAAGETPPGLDGPAREETCVLRRVS